MGRWSVSSFSPFFVFCFFAGLVCLFLFVYWFYLFLLVVVPWVGTKGNLS